MSVSLTISYGLGKNNDCWALVPGLRFFENHESPLLPSREENISSLGAAVQHNFRRTQLPPSTEENISSLRTAVQHNFRRTLLVPSREEYISSLGTAEQHKFRRTLLVLSREENISGLGAAVQHNLVPKYIGCQAKRQRVQWDPQRVQLHPLHLPGYGPVRNIILHHYVIHASAIMPIPSY